MPPEVGEYDPATALWGGTDGLDAIRVVEQAARRLLRPGGLVAVEHGAPQGAAVYWVFAEERGWRDTRNHKDLAGRRPVRHRDLARPAAVGGWIAMSARFDCADPAQLPQGIAEAAAALRRGELVVLPTDTVYGIAPTPSTRRPWTALLEAKGRGRDMPPPVLVGTVRAAIALVEDLAAPART